jgi:hypothetical protein
MSAKPSIRTCNWAATGSSPVGDPAGRSLPAGSPDRASDTAGPGLPSPPFRPCELASVNARIEVQSHTVLDLDQRLAQIEAAVSEMTRRGNSARALEAIGARRKAERHWQANADAEPTPLAGLKAQLAATGAKGSAVEVEATSIRYVATLFGGTSEQAIRLLILLIVLTCDPFSDRLDGRGKSKRRGAVMGRDSRLATRRILTGVEAQA